MAEDIRQLLAAFRYGMLLDVVVADDRLIRAEVKALLDMQDEMIAVDLMNADGTLREAYEDVRWHAYDVLPDALDHQAKLDLVADLHRAAMADGELDINEHALVSDAAQRLGIPYQTLRQHLVNI